MFTLKDCIFFATLPSSIYKKASAIDGAYQSVGAILGSAVFAVHEISSPSRFGIHLFFLGLIFLISLLSFFAFKKLSNTSDANNTSSQAKGTKKDGQKNEASVNFFSFKNLLSGGLIFLLSYFGSLCATLFTTSLAWVVTDYLSLIHI